MRIFNKMSLIKKDKRYKYTVFTYIPSIFFTILLEFSGVAQSLDMFIYDFAVNYSSNASKKHLPITIVEITEQDIKRLGWPIEDEKICSVLDMISNYQPLAIGLDLYRDKGVGPNSLCLNQAFKNNSKLISIYNLSGDISHVPGTPKNRQAYNDLVVDIDGVIRRDLVHVIGQGESSVSFPLRLKEVADGNNELLKNIERGIYKESWLTPNSGGYHRDVDLSFGFQRLLYFREPNAFDTYSFSSALDGTLNSNKIENRIILIGSTAASLKDFYQVPYSKFRSKDKVLNMSGVEIHANRLANFFDKEIGLKSFLFLMPGWGNLSIILFMFLLTIFIGETQRNIKNNLFSFVFIFTIYLSSSVFLLFKGIWLGIAIPSSILLFNGISSLLSKGFLNQKHERQIRQLLGQATSPEIASQLWEQREQLLKDGRFEGKKINVTILFSDIVNFTTISEKLNPQLLMEWVNRGMAICVPAVTERSGMVNKFTGDGMLAAFGVPISSNREEEALSAIKAASEINEKLKTLNKSLSLENLPEMRMRIGIHSGEILAGSMGSAERLEYAIIGDTVNCASRLESIQKERYEGPLRVLFSEETMTLIKKNVLDEEYVEWGSMKVKGREKELNVYQLKFQ